MNRKKTAVAAVGFLLFAAFTMIDIWTGPEIASSLFYILPVLYFSVLLGRKSGLAAALLAGLLWLYVDAVTGIKFGSGFVEGWNVFSSFCVFVLVAGIASYLAREIRTIRKINLELKGKNEEIRRLMNVKSQFTSMVSHEIRTPLFAIRENLRIVQDGTCGPLSAEQQEFLDLAMRGAARLTLLINDILDFQKLESGRIQLELKKAEVSELLSEAARHYEVLARGKGLEIRCDCPGPAWALMDRNRIMQVVQNLVHNAIKFSGKGTITLKAVRSAGGHVRISVADQGPGIKEEDIPKLFESFSQLTDAGGETPHGTGLGLAICRKIIEAHGGEIGVESKPDDGSTFFFTLPPAEEETAARTEHNAG